MDNYKKLEIEIIVFENDDVIVTSNEGNGDINFDDTDD